MSLISEDQALAAVLAATRPRPTELLPLLAASRRYSAETLRASMPQPGFDNSAMDGYALRAADGFAGNTLRILPGEQAAGIADPSLSVAAGTALRIFTGAPVPEGSEAVIMQEDVQRDDDRLTIIEGIEAGENIRRKGCDLCEGQLILRPGDELTPARLGLLASQGRSHALVHQLPTAAVVSTGDELIPPGSTLLPGQLFESNSTMLAALLQEAGLSKVRTHHGADDREQLTALLARLMVEFDVIILSGGVSVGDHDHVRPALAALGVSPELWRVKIKPGKPFLFCHTERCSIFGLPGNPVSSYVTYQLFVRPALLRMMGATSTAPPLQPAHLGTAVTNHGDRPHYLRGHCADGIFHSTGLQQSHALFGLSQANALLRLEAESQLEAGASCRVWRL